MEKTIEQIKEDVARGHGYPNWIDFINDQPNYNVELIMNEVAIRYAQQFKDQNDLLYKQISELDSRCRDLQILLSKLYNSDGWLTQEDHKKIQSLINKSK